MQRGAYFVMASILIFIVTVINYSMTDERTGSGSSRSHGGTTIFIPGGGSSGWHK